VKKLVMITAAGALALGGVTAAGAASASPTSPAAKISWSTCSGPYGSSYGAECGFLSVPLDYAHPQGAKIKIAVSRIKHKTAKSQGVMLVNPGGPGGSGLTLPAFFTSPGVVPKKAADAYDWIGFDPRGVGSSQPTLSCIPTYFGYNRPNFIPTTKSLETYWLKRSKQYTTACEQKNAALLPHMKTIDAVKDMDGIRAALGAKQINFYGFSYGTYLGQVYSSLWPSKVRRMVLDGNVDPRRVWYAANLDQDVAFNKNIKIWFKWVADNNATFKLGTSEKTVEKLWYAQRAKLGKTPAGGKIGPDEWTDIFLQAGYYVYGWSDMGKAFSDWVTKGDQASIDELIGLYDSSAGPTDDNGFAVYNAVQCTDVQWPTSWAKWKKDNWNTYAKAPFETWDNAWFNAPCLTWPAKAGKPVHVDGKKVPGILLISETNDAATPFTGSLQVRKLYPRSSLIEGVGGTTHAGSLSGVACTDDKIADYLLSGKLPTRLSGDRSDVKCAPVPAPPADSAYPQAVARSQAARAAGGLGAHPSFGRP
jgi:pimeloyl-ACP methyl ester carboxylesterase